MSVKPDAPTFQSYQRAFTDHIRDPKRHPRPAQVPAQRMRVYSHFVYANIESFLVSCFPVLRAAIGVRKWHALVRDFVIDHRCQTPLFRRIPEEFLQYIEQERAPAVGDPSYLQALAHYEWIELALSVADTAIDMSAVDANGDVFLGRPVFNPVCALLCYPYAVHRIGPRYRLKASDTIETYLFVFRDLTDNVKFIHLNAAGARLVDLLRSQELSGRDAVDTIAGGAGPMVADGRRLLQALQERQAILGVRRRTQRAL